MRTSQPFNRAGVRPLVAWNRQTIVMKGLCRMADGRKRKEGEKQVNKAGQSRGMTRRIVGGAVFDVLESRVLLSATVRCWGVVVQGGSSGELSADGGGERSAGCFGAIQDISLTITYQDILTATKAQDVDVETLSSSSSRTFRSAGRHAGRSRMGARPSAAAVGHECRQRGHADVDAPRRRGEAARSTPLR